MFTLSLMWPAPPSRLGRARARLTSAPVNAFHQNRQLLTRGQKGHKANGINTSGNVACVAFQCSTIQAPSNLTTSTTTTVGHPEGPSFVGASHPRLTATSSRRSLGRAARRLPIRPMRFQWARSRRLCFQPITSIEEVMYYYKEAPLLS
jgi:hypothetical protein